ncbi:cell division protein FtsN [Parazoarcus communis]|uniref:Cell division protein FtsN n=1 Tax=Parazoarcus communis TaxID=41977 RepID=A0A2U8GSX0_9RHOO|nr:SPOR domain-containing protein [Parazoarcus communis]AWI76671.1 cell division protein FtsN [Parazoarcus communis]
MTQPRKAPRKSGRAPARSGGGTLIGIFIGLMLGALIAAGAAWFFTRANPFQSAPVAPRVPAVNQPPAALPGKPGDRPVVKQDFEFYKILPQGDNVPAAQAPVEAPSAPVVERPVEKLYLQLGAFENAAEADNLKARLALAGVEASSQRGQLPDGRTVHRVRIGPFSGPDELNPVRSRLASSGFNTTVTRAGQ